MNTTHYKHGIGFCGAFDMADYVIIGGGIYGCTVAWELAKRGADVHLLFSLSGIPSC